MNKPRSIVILLLSVVLGCGTVFAAKFEKDVVTIAYFDRPPFFFRGNPPTGIFIDLATAIFKDAGIPFKFVEMPINRTFLDIENDEPLCALGLVRNVERERIGWYSEPIYRSKSLVVLVKADKRDRFADVTTLSQMVADRRFCPGLAKSFVYNSDDLNLRLRARQAECDMPDALHHNLFGMLLAERVDYIVTTLEESEYLAQHQPGAFAELLFKDAPHNEFRYLLCANSIDPEIRRRIDASIIRVMQLQ